MKAILILDEMPKRCLECPLYYDILRCILCENDYHEMAADDPCPLHPLPERKEEMDYLAAGYNKCLDDILEGE